MDSLITIQGLKKRFRRVDALRGIDLEIPAGQVTAFLGPNGSGKTTTIKCALNLHDRDEGRVEVMGVDARRLEDAGYVLCSKSFEGRTPRTEYALTEQGRRALQAYLDHMEAIIRATKDR